MPFADWHKCKYWHFRPRGCPYQGFGFHEPEEHRQRSEQLHLESFEARPRETVSPLANLITEEGLARSAINRPPAEVPRIEAVSRIPQDIVERVTNEVPHVEATQAEFEAARSLEDVVRQVQDMPMSRLPNSEAFQHVMRSYARSFPEQAGAFRYYGDESVREFENRVNQSIGILAPYGSEDRPVRGGSSFNRGRPGFGTPDFELERQIQGRHMSALWAGVTGAVGTFMRFAPGRPRPTFRTDPPDFDWVPESVKNLPKSVQRVRQYQHLFDAH